MTGSKGIDPASYQYTVTGEGRLRARELMEQCQYTGPAPVSLEIYAKMVQAQSIAKRGFARKDLERALSRLVLPDALLNQLGPAVNAGKAVFLFGNTGDGKTSIGLALGAMMPGAIWVPHCVEVEGQIIKVFDSGVHHAFKEEPRIHAAPVRPGLLSHLVVEKTDDGRLISNKEVSDERWTLVHRPPVVGGGELTLENLALVFDPEMKYYEAPHQMKANGGVLLLDDLGRQKMSAREILNRWILPLEKRIDYLTLVTKNRIKAPFDTLLIFATNLKPAEVADEVFLRRLRYKIHVTDPTWEAYADIFRREAEKRNIPYSDEGRKRVVFNYYVKPKRVPRGVHPRDILDELVDIARYRGIAPAMSNELLDLACEAYFLKGAAAIKSN